MLGTKLVLIAAAVALAIGTAEASVIRVQVHREHHVVKHAVHHKHHLKGARTCAGGATPMSVEGVEGSFCVNGNACAASVNGTCPEPQKGLDYGAYCDKVKTNVFGCKPFKSMADWKKAHPEEDDDDDDEGDDDDMCDADNEETPVSVEGVKGSFCAMGQVCVDKIEGACPMPQPGLEFGSYCDEVKTGVLGCKPYGSWEEYHADHPDLDDKEETEEHDDDDVCDAEKEETQMSVEGVEGVYCVQGQACVDKYDGACPVPQPGLEFGAYCDEVKTGVMGCKPYKSWEEYHADHPEESGEVEDDVCDIKNGESPMSVEGVDDIFCVAGPACAGVDGACPGPQDGLEFGSHCAKVASGALGCIPCDSMDEWNASHGHKKHHHKATTKHHVKKFKKTHHKKH